MDDLEKLCNDIDMPEEVNELLKGVVLGLSENEENGFLADFCDKVGYKAATEKLPKLFPDDERGLKKLKLLLSAALKTRALYEKNHIDDKIFVDTMKCFSRFVREHKAAFGSYGFDRDFWVGRQLSLCLFRLGELEYESGEWEGKKLLSVHIPSDADLSPEKVDVSLSFARKFFASHFPEYADAKFACYSWLLSPALEKLLPENSKIIQFRRRFEILEVNENADGYKLWVYKTTTLPPEEFPENTSLQRNMKKYILNGGKIGEALGIIR